MQVVESMLSLERYSIVLVIRYGDSIYMLQLWNYVIDL
jgi:hypothetical protein